MKNKLHSLYIKNSENYCNILKKKIPPIKNNYA